MNEVESSKKEEKPQISQEKGKHPENPSVNSCERKKEDTVQPIADLEAQVQEWKEKCLRAVAELANARKRFENEKESVRFHTTQIICLHIIELFDSFRMGLTSAEQQKQKMDLQKIDPKVLKDFQMIFEGFQMIFRQFQAQLKLLKIEEFHPVHDRFDPHVQEAVSHAYSDTVPEDHVIQVVRSGYRCGERLLRAASVVVSDGKEPKKAEA